MVEGEQDPGRAQGSAQHPRAPPGHRSSHNTSCALKALRAMSC
jgi:hypothetical protein